MDSLEDRVRTRSGAQRGWHSLLDHERETADLASSSAFGNGSLRGGFAQCANSGLISLLGRGGVLALDRVDCAPESSAGGASGNDISFLSTISLASAFARGSGICHGGSLITGGNPQFADIDIEIYSEFQMDFLRMARCKGGGLRA
jgi:hypothetical protein